MDPGEKKSKNPMCEQLPDSTSYSSKTLQGPWGDTTTESEPHQILPYISHFLFLLFDIFQTFDYHKCHQVTGRLRLAFLLLKAVTAIVQIQNAQNLKSECRGRVPTQIGGACSPLVIFYLEKASSKGRSGFAGAKTVLITCATVRRGLGREGCKIIAFHRRFNLLEFGK